MTAGRSTQTLVFYDGTCAVCNAEMKILRGWDRAQRLTMIDIAAADFAVDPHAWPVSLADMHALLHVRLPDGTWLNAMAATRHLYRVVGRGWLLAFTGWPLLAGLFDRAYAWFARHRLPISGFLGLRRCTDGPDSICRIDRNTTGTTHHHSEPPLDVGAPHLKFLIAGGTGFIGTALTRRLIAGGHEVTLVARDALRAATQFNGAVRCVAAAATLSPAEQYDVVVNLAGAPVVGAPWTRARKQVLLDSRLAPTDDLLRFVERVHSRPRVWIQASATGYYGQRATNIDEHTPAGISDFASELCHRWEARAQSSAALGMRYVALRFGVVLGREGGSLPLLLLGLKLGAGSVLGNGRQFVSWLHIEDALGIIAHAVRDAKLTGPINAVAPESLSYAAFMREAGAVMHRPVWLRIPEQLLRKLLGEMAIMLVEGPCVLPGKLRTLRHEFRFRTLRAALTDLA
jgi:uncharacterized protein (TIGR01777 family)